MPKVAEPCPVSSGRAMFAPAVNVEQPVFAESVGPRQFNGILARRFALTASGYVN